jgi:hypothetical protein
MKKNLRKPTAELHTLGIKSWDYFADILSQIWSLQDHDHLRKGAITEKEKDLRDAWSVKPFYSGTYLRPVYLEQFSTKQAKIRFMTLA